MAQSSTTRATPATNYPILVKVGFKKQSKGAYTIKTRHIRRCSIEEEALFKPVIANNSTNYLHNSTNDDNHSVDNAPLLLNDEYDLMNKEVHPLHYYNNPLHDAGVSTNDKDHLPNCLCYSMKVADHSANHCDYSSNY